MTKKKKSRNAGTGRKLLALGLSMVAAKVAMRATEKIWTRGLGQNLPEMSERESIIKKAGWVALSAAVVGMARELTKDLALPSARRA